MKKNNILAAVIGAAICIPVKNGVNNLYDVVFSDMMNSSEGVKMSVCSLLAIVISAALAVVVVWLLNVLKNKESD
ncbi:MAG: hypothetical protein J5805_03310 [Bacteroidaceae bacterium]|nr:hypothetical protein [Bacteroidaceae bacterium]